MAFLDNLRHAPDRGAAVASYAKLALQYDATCHWLDRIRTEALEVLDPREGETIVDVACGTGAMLPALARAVGSRGRVIGIEQCPEMAAIARRRIADAGVENVILVVAPGKEGGMVWQFTRPGEFYYACLMPGHMEAGMVSKIIVK